jgi:N-methylhydantoinase A/oxoprolinase/acetone carboxylase beta subunit
VSRDGIVFGVDTGGTFTDIIGLDATGRVLMRKVDNRAADATASIAAAVESLTREARREPDAVLRIVHCTTILGNAVIERKGPVCGLITTAGFRDVLELGRQHNPVLYDIFWKKARPLVPRRRVVEVQERIAADGRVIVALDMASLDAALQKLETHGVQSVAICLINACTNPVHEEAIAKRIGARLPGITISLSSRVSPEWGEYERTSTTVTDAFLKPIFAGYLEALQRNLRDRKLAPELFIMQSAGSIAPVDAAAAMPVHSLESGPAAAVIAAVNIGAALGFRNVLTLEIGGTTAKSTLIEDGEPRRSIESEIGTPIGSDGRALRGGGYALRVPVIDSAEVGAGGGSIARVDAGGSLSVGPEGAGAFPGPASYGRGGSAPTVTDANLVLGYLSDDEPLGGTIRLDRGLAERAVDEHVARPLGISRLEAAFAIRSLANATIARAVRTVSTERGRDVRRFALLAAGGGGPGHAAEIARNLGISTIVIPPFAGLFAALGMLWSAPERRVARAAKIRLDRVDAARDIEAILRELRADLGNPRDGTSVREEADVHYVGQFHDLTVRIVRGGGAVDPTGIRGQFEDEHERTYGYRSERESCEIRSVRLIVRPDCAAMRPDMLNDRLNQEVARDAHRPEARQVYFGPKLGARSARLLSRASLSAQPIQGPIVIPEYDTTVVVPPDFTVRREGSGALILEQVAPRG